MLTRQLALASDLDTQHAVAAAAALIHLGLGAMPRLAPHLNHLPRLFHTVHLTMHRNRYLSLSMIEVLLCLRLQSILCTNCRSHVWYVLAPHMSLCIHVQKSAMAYHAARLIALVRSESGTALIHGCMCDHVPSETCRVTAWRRLSRSNSISQSMCNHIECHV